MTITPPPVIGAHRDPTLTDRDVLDDHSLQQDRLRGSIARGKNWRMREDPGMLRRLIGSALLAALAVGTMAVVGFMQKQLEIKKKQEQQQQRQLRPTPTPSATPSSSVPGRPTHRPVKPSPTSIPPAASHSPSA